TQPRRTDNSTAASDQRWRNPSPSASVAGDVDQRAAPDVVAPVRLVVTADSCSPSCLVEPSQPSRRHAACEILPVRPSGDDALNEHRLALRGTVMSALRKPGHAPK